MVTQAHPVAALTASMEVVVLHTTVPETLQALRTAAHLAHDLSARIRLLVLEVVPYPLPLERPVVTLPFTQRRFRTLAANLSIETNVDIHLGRDREKMLESLLEPHSVIIVGVHRKWWPSGRTRLVKCLERRGHQVVFAG